MAQRKTKRQRGGAKFAFGLINKHYILELSLKRFYALSILLATSLFADDYTLGQGKKINDYITLGGYFSAEYEHSNDTKKFAVEDTALMAYGEITQNISYLVEFESSNMYLRDFEAKSEHRYKNFDVERMYVDAKYNEYLQLRAGKFLTPIGYWNQTPINVLRESTSNPYVATYLYPKLVSGGMLYGDIYGTNNLKYQLFAQNNRDIDEGYNNILADSFNGVNIKYQNDDSELWLGGGKYKKMHISDEYGVASVGAKYSTRVFKIFSEAAISKNNTETLRGMYVQGEYKVAAKHKFVTRYEYYDDKASRTNLLMMGWSYRPVYPVSLKGEVDVKTNGGGRALLSLSVLF